MISVRIIHVIITTLPNNGYDITNDFDYNLCTGNA